MKSFAIWSAALLIHLAAANAQPSLSCDHRNQNSSCEIREVTLPFSGSISADTGGVGAITVKGWENAYVFVRAQVTTSAEDECEARLIAPAVEIDTSSNHIWASGPSGKSWAVSYEVSVPRESGVELKTRVGAVTIRDVAGTIHFKAAVGSITLTRLAGEVDGETAVGAITIGLAGDRWDGKGINVRTGTGAIRISAPSNYSASFALGTGLGTIVADFPGANVRSMGLLGRQLAFEVGAGGPAIQATTAIGEIDLTRVTTAK
jgi:hypothetical protein